jgi:uncharacterized protein related to proFAR isomerase
MIILQAAIAEVSDIKSGNVVVSKPPDVDENESMRVVVSEPPASPDVEESELCVVVSEPPDVDESNPLILLTLSR